MAITFQTANIKSGAINAGTTLTIADMTVDAGAGDRVAFVDVYLESSTDLVSGVTWGGNTMTRRGTRAQGGLRTMYRYILKNVATGTTDDVVVSLSSAAEVMAVAYVGEGIDQTTTFTGAFQSNGGNSGTTYTLNATSQTGDTVLASAGSVNSTTDLVDGAGQTRLARANNATINATTTVNTEPGATSVTVDWTGGPNSIWIVIGDSLIPTGGGGGGGASPWLYVRFVNN